MAIAPAPAAPAEALPAARPAPGAPANRGADAPPQAEEFAQLLADGLADIAAEKPGARAGSLPDDATSEASDPQAAPPVVAFVLASLNHPAAAPSPAGAVMHAATDQDAPAAAHAEPGARTAVADDVLNAARDSAPAFVPVPRESALEAIDAEVPRPTVSSFADTLGAAAAPGQPQAPAHVQAPGDRTAMVSVSTPVGSPGWGEELGHKLVWMAGKGEQVAAMRLNPPDLGPVEIRVTLNGDQGNQASVQFASAHAGVREAIQSAMPSLHAMFADAGLRLDQSSVSAESFREQGAFAGERNGSGRDAPRHQPPVDQPPPRMRSGGHSLVDTFA